MISRFKEKNVTSGAKMPSTAEKTEPKDIVIALRIPRRVHKALTKTAKKDDKTLAATVRYILGTHLKCL